MSALDVLDISELSVGEVVYLSLALTLAFTVIALGVAWLWRRYKG